MTQCITRRAALSLFSTAAAGAVQKKTPSKQILPRVGEFVRFADEITEIPVVRLTSLAHASSLPARENRAVSTKGRFLVFASDQAGSLSPFRVDLRTGIVTQLLSTEKLDPGSLSLDPAGRSLFFLDGNALREVNLGNKRVQTIAEGVSQYSVGSSPGELLTIHEGKLHGPENTVLAESAAWCQIRPSGGGCLFSRGSRETGGELWYVALSATPRPVRVAQGPVFDPCWSPDGRSVLFLRNGSICEVVPETGGEQKMGGSSQYAAFAPNADASVFVGAARSKAQPTVNLLLRNPARELTLCEHKASHPEACAPVFSGDSRRVYFNSDFQGKPAIYSVNVEALIEETSG